MKVRLFCIISILLIIFGKNARSQQVLMLDTANSHMVVIKFALPGLSRQRTVRVFLPSSYYHSSRRYPVIYMQDGQNLFLNIKQPRDSWYADSLVNSFPANRQAIIIGINNGGDKYRMTEYNPYDSNYGRGEGALYTSFIVNVLKPYIDKHYKTKPSFKNTAIAGSSMGGLIAMYAAVKYDHVFGYAGIFSPAFWMAPKIYDDVAGSNINSRSNFFLACGDQEGNEPVYVKKMDSILYSKKPNLKNIPDPLILKNARHNEQQWRIAFDLFYKWFLK